MSGKLPQTTTTISKRLRRAAKGLRAFDGVGLSLQQTQAFANTCDQAAGRLDTFLEVHGEDVVPEPEPESTTLIDQLKASLADQERGR